MANCNNFWKDFAAFDECVAIRSVGGTRSDGSSLSCANFGIAFGSLLGVTADEFSSELLGGTGSD